VHTVYAGQTIGKIAKRYNVSIESLCQANGIARSSRIQPGQTLVIPGVGDETGPRRDSRSDEGAARAEPKRSKKRPDWRQYRKPAWRKGYIVLQGLTGSFRGYAIGPDGRVLAGARKKVAEALASWRTGKRVPIDARLIQLIARVSDTFGGRPIRVVSGFREHSHSAHSRHPQGRALDFSIQGVPEWAVRDYLKTLPDVGVGYYPNSTFVHMDVREASTHWVDYAGPGEAPRIAGSAP
jgi:LysM repeat protein